MICPQDTGKLLGINHKEVNYIYNTTSARRKTR